jgi:hypothetical protein
VFGVTWSEGVDDGGTTQPLTGRRLQFREGGFVEYRLWYALENESYVNYIDGITDEYYTTSFLTTDGENYKFKVQARNTVGYGPFSDEIIIRAARIPDPPSSILTTVNIPNSSPLTVEPMVMSWTTEYNGGSPILSYTILIL